MSDITIIGLGAMGSALASAQIKAGHQVGLWNRSMSKAEALAREGGTAIADFRAAVDASSILMICVSNYESLLPHWTELDDLSGKTVIEFSTGTPAEARKASRQFEDLGANYLDGAILNYPNAIGQPDCPIIIGGDRQAFEVAKPYLAHLTPDLRYLGEGVASANALDLALLTMSVSIYAGVAQAVHACEKEGAPLDQLVKLARHGELAQMRLEVACNKAFALNSLHPGATLAVWSGVAERLLQQAQESDLDQALPGQLAELYRRGTQAGHGDEDVAALVKVLR